MSDKGRLVMAGNMAGFTIHMARLSRLPAIGLSGCYFPFVVAGISWPVTQRDARGGVTEGQRTTNNFWRGEAKPCRHGMGSSGRKGQAGKRAE